MRRLALVLALLLAAVAPAAAQQMKLPDRIVAVWGHGAAHARPDMAEFSAGVVSEGETAEAAISANSRAMEKVIAAARNMGLTGRALQTQGVNLNPVYARPDRPGAPQHIESYRASNTLHVRLDDLGKLGALLDALTRAGANMANGLTLGVADTDALADRARQKAMADARRKAGLLAKAAGVGLGTVVSISEEGGGGRPVPLRASAMSMKAAAPVPIEPGETTIDATVRVVYAIE